MPQAGPRILAEPIERAYARARMLYRKRRDPDGRAYTLDGLMKGGEATGEAVWYVTVLLGLQASPRIFLRCKTPPGKRTSKKRHKRWWIRKKIPLDFVRQATSNAIAKVLRAGRWRTVEPKSKLAAWLVIALQGPKRDESGRKAKEGAIPREARKLFRAELRVQYARLSNRGTAD